MAHIIPPGPGYDPDFIADMVTIYDSLAVLLTAIDTTLAAASVPPIIPGPSTAAISAWVAASNVIMLKYRVAALEEIMPPEAVTYVKTELLYDPDKLFVIDSTPLTAG